MRNSAFVMAAVAATLLGTACRQQQQQKAPVAAATPAAALAVWPVTVEPLSIAAPPGSAEPQLTSSGRGVILSWIEQTAGTASLKFAEHTGSGWSAPQRVASGRDWFVSWADVPTVMRLANGTLVANWFRSTQVELEAYDLWLSHSSDEGKTWAKPFMPHHDHTKTQHGFATLFEQPSGLGLVWLDAREWELAKDDPEGGSMMLRYAAFDGQWKQTVDAPLNLRVCECCQTAVAATTDGIVTAFRDRTDKEIRDIAVSRLENGAWSTPKIVHDDNWEVDSCPVNGPALSANGRNLAAAWFTAKGDQGQAYAAFSTDAGRTWGTPIRLDDGKSLGHVDIEMLDGTSAVATWAEFADQRARFRMRRIEASGAKSAPIEIAGSGAGHVSGYPRLARHGNELVFAWTESSSEDEGAGTQQVKAAMARLPQ